MAEDTLHQHKALMVEGFLGLAMRLAHTLAQVGDRMRPRSAAHLEH